MTQPLPDRPSLEHLKKQAKSLLRAAREGQPEALDRFAKYLADPPGSNWGATPESRSTHSGLKLADAQHVVAKEYGCANWSQLRQQVEDAIIATVSQQDRAAKLIQYCLDGEFGRAERLAERYPELTQRDLFVAATLGELAAARSLLAGDPTWVRRAGGPLNAQPLVYTCTSRCASPSHARQANMLAIAGELLQRGADPNAAWRNPEFGNSPMSALYGACGVNGNGMLATLLLEAGATPNDNESLYHSVEHQSSNCTAILLAHGAVIPGTNAVHHAVSLGNLDAVKLLLQHGADVNLRLNHQHGMTLLHWAIECGQDRDMLELLISHGADLRAKGLDGVTPYRRAMHCGHRTAVELLTAQGVAESLTPDEQLLSACMLGDQPLAIRLAAERPGGIERMPAHGRGLLNAAAWRGNEAAVEAMLAIGFDVAWGNQQAATALHAAAWQGYVSLVQRLLKRGAPLDLRDTEFVCTPLEWALHGSCHCSRRIGDGTTSARSEAYATIVESLLAAGSPPPVARLVRPCRGMVRAVLDTAGFVDDDDDDE